MGRKYTENVQDRPQSKVDNYWERKNLVRKNTSIEDFLISPQTGVLFLGIPPSNQLSHYSLHWSQSNLFQVHIWSCWLSASTIFHCFWDTIQIPQQFLVPAYTSRLFFGELNPLLSNTQTDKLYFQSYWTSFNTKPLFPLPIFLNVFPLPRARLLLFFPWPCLRLDMPQEAF